MVCLRRRPEHAGAPSSCFNACPSALPSGALSASPALSLAYRSGNDTRKDALYSASPSLSACWTCAEAPQRQCGRKLGPLLQRACRAFSTSEGNSRLPLLFTRCATTSGVSGSDDGHAISLKSCLRYSHSRRATRAMHEADYISLLCRTGFARRRGVVCVLRSDACFGSWLWVVGDARLSRMRDNPSLT